MKSTVLEGISVELQSGFSHFTRILRGCFEVSCFFSHHLEPCQETNWKRDRRDRDLHKCHWWLVETLPNLRFSGELGDCPSNFLPPISWPKYQKKIFMRTSRIILYIIERSKNKKHVEVDGSPQPVFERYQKGFNGYMQYRVVRASGKPTRGLATSNLALAFKVQVIQAFKRKIDVAIELELDTLSTANHTPTTKLLFPL